jgi:hypothetical protein
MSEDLHPQESWLSPHLRRAFMIPPLLAVPTLALVLHFLDPTAPPMPWALWIGITAAAYVLQFTYGTLCYFVLNRFRRLRLSAIIIASQLPALVALLAFDLPTVVAYSLVTLTMALASAYFVIRRPSGGAP